jgi:hypothetical protein
MATSDPADLGARQPGDGYVHRLQSTTRRADHHLSGLDDERLAMHAVRLRPGLLIKGTYLIQRPGAAAEPFGGVRHQRHHIRGNGGRKKLLKQRVETWRTCQANRQQSS